MSDNTVSLSGNLTRDPELRFTQGGRAVCTIGLAVNRRYMVNNEWKDDPTFVNVIAWAELGENAGSSLTKGQRIIVEGRLSIRSYETDQGEKKYVTEVIADDIGASLKWATAQIERTTRTTGQAAPPPPSEPAESVPHGDEEPF